MGSDGTRQRRSYSMMLTVDKVSELLGVSRSGYSDAIDRPPCRLLHAQQTHRMRQRLEDRLMRCRKRDHRGAPPANVTAGTSMGMVTPAGSKSARCAAMDCGGDTLRIDRPPHESGLTSKPQEKRERPASQSKARAAPITRSSARLAIPRRGGRHQSPTPLRQQTHYLKPLCVRQTVRADAACASSTTNATRARAQPKQKRSLVRHASKTQPGRKSGGAAASASSSDVCKSSFTSRRPGKTPSEEQERR